MAKYLCKVDLRCVDGAVAFKAGNTYKEYKQLSEFICLVSEEGIACAINVRGENGWFHAFELVNPEWPETFLVIASGATLRHAPEAKDSGGEYFETTGFDEYSFDLESARSIVDWVTKWIEAAESEAGE